MSKTTLLMLSATAMFGATLVAPNAVLAQFPPGPPPMLAGPPPGLGAGGPPPGLGVGSPPLGGPQAGSVAGLPPRAGATPREMSVFRSVAARTDLRAILPMVAIWTAQPDCTVSIAADRPVFVASKLAPRLTAPIATPAIVTTAMAVATVIGRMRRLRLTPMADPTRPPTTLATTSIGETARGAFRSVMETD
jgi:hypothetical protein